jgi:LysM repeat protein
MAYVQPRGTSHDLSAAALRQGTRFVAVAAYAAAVAVAIVLLSPVLPGRGSSAATVPTGPQPVLYTVSPADTPDVIAASHGISLAQLYALNPNLTPLTRAQGEQVVVGLR